MCTDADDILDYEEMNELLCTAADINRRENICNKSYPVEGLSTIGLRDALYKIGVIMTENLERQYYIVRINAGFLKRNHALLVVQLENQTLKIAAYADEGIINQHTSEGAIDELCNALQKCIQYDRN